ncbi:MAG: sigma-54-dependent Fis family transcriptional regulator [Gammaproteobacteria bacterium RIFCSPLOWO2_02_FULL_61_13]|nr:MAG: sigma-54-dependent Fis family transcriptional regulator [Gammaproteobacteria bacterium RIFCSPLOWO2_02_FULL_61_13]
MRSALIIDDEPDIRELLELTLGDMSVTCACAPDLRTAKALLKKQSFGICLTDMRLPDGDGVDFVGYLQRHHPNLPVAVITAHGSMDTAIQALKKGAFDFLNKPVDLAHLRTLVENALQASETEVQSIPRLIGTSTAMRVIREKVAKVCRSQAPVYISGESGVGKEMVARMIHDEGPRRSGPFVPVNCGAIPPDLMESEFFGHRKGSFSGATADKIGLFQAAEAGTLFLDEVAELPQAMQVKLLRSIQEKKVRPVGDQKETPVNVRILSATHKNLAALVRTGAFREDLFYRIHVIELNVPPLRERREDIPALVEHILGRVSQGPGMERVTLSAAAMNALLEYPFPGNVRELENILERAATLCEQAVINPADLQLPRTDAGTAAPISGGVISASDEAKLDEHLGDVERNLILDALEQTRWNRTAAARILGLSLRSLRYRLKKLGLE